MNEIDPDVYGEFGTLRIKDVGDFTLPIIDRKYKVTQQYSGIILLKII